MVVFTWDLEPLCGLTWTLTRILLVLIIIRYIFHQVFTETPSKPAENEITEPQRVISSDDDLARGEWQQYERCTRQRLLQRADARGFCHACEAITHDAFYEKQDVPGSSHLAEPEFIHHQFRALELSTSRGCALCGLFLDTAVAGQARQSAKRRETRDQILARLRIRNATGAVQVDLRNGRMWYKTRDSGHAIPLEIFHHDKNEVHRPDIVGGTGERYYISFIHQVLRRHVNYAALSSLWAALMLRTGWRRDAAKMERHSPVPERLGLRARYINRHPTSESCFDLAKSWIRRCMAEHPRCRQGAAAHRLPRRLLRIERSLVCLVEGDEIVQPEPYAILSYCWGSSRSLETTTENISSHKQGIAITSLPQTLRDAVMVAQKLGIAYIWIDALCILQNSKADWETECNKMGSYYKNAVLTISALDADTAHTGFLQQRPDEYIAPLRPGGTEDLWVRRRRREWGDIFAGAPLNTRAWALQERLLSTRVLHFSSTELLWECLTCCAREGSHDENTALEDSSELVRSEGQDFKRCLVTRGSDPFSRRDGAFDLWYRLVGQYSRRLLTRPSDRLAAIAGLGRHVGELAGTEYMSGIFKNDLASLCWSPGVPIDTLTSRAPSWSWASAAGVIAYPFREYTASQSPADAKFVAHYADGDSEIIQLECHFRPIEYIYDSQCVGYANSDPRLDRDSAVAVRICTRRNEASVPQLYLHNKNSWQVGRRKKTGEDAKCQCRGPMSEEVVYFLILALWRGSHCWGRIGLGRAAGAEGCLVDEDRVSFVSEGKMVFNIGGPP